MVNTKLLGMPIININVNKRRCEKERVNKTIDHGNTRLYKHEGLFLKDVWAVEPVHVTLSKQHTSEA